ncbi:MAG: hypothetical protein AD742_13690 [Methylibium sp. NZG]|nr:MAG: hypothetical protein AD742_13690 [Methylibium sp. NZG]
MNCVLRAAATGLMACGAAVATAASWDVTLADGRRVAIVPDGSADPSSQVLERRHPDGSLDRQFGEAGRVLFSLGADSPGPRSIRVDEAGRLLIVGAAQGPKGLAVPAAMRFLPDGRLDVAWGVQGRSLVPSTEADAYGADLLPLPDKSLLVLGQVETTAGEQAALWRILSNGSFDPTFGQGGTMRSSGIESSQALALQLDDEGAALIALLTLQQGQPWLDLHRWQAGQVQPQRVAYQPMPADWQGPVTLARRGGTWQWFDASQPLTSGGVPLVAMAATAVWAAGTSAADAQIAATGATATSAVSEGGAAYNPFSPPTVGAAGPNSGLATSLELPWIALALLAFAALAGLGWWRWRRR